VREIVLKPGRERPVRAGHPWVFSGAIASGLDGADAGDPVQVRAHDGRVLGVGYANPKTTIAVRLVSHRDEPFDDALVARRLDEALALRRTCLPAATAYRLLNGEGDRLPGVALKAHDIVTVSGRVAELPSAGLAGGRAAPAPEAGWPKITSYPAMAELSAAIGRPLEPRILLLDPQQPDGYVRDWQPPGLQPIRHWSYAIQWWCFAALALVLWAALSLRRPRDGA